MAPQVIRPENIVKTCEHLIKIGNSDEALDTLKSFISSKRFKYVAAASAEQIGLLFVQICVDKIDSRTAKEGLFSFKKSMQGVANGLETVGAVVKRYIQLAEESLAKAKKSATDAKTGEVTSLDEDDKSPEALLLSIVSSDDSADRSDRDILTPYLKFMYESYKSCLDIIRNIKQLEGIYCTIVNHSFRFCESYERRQEFKRLSDLIRTHLQSISYYANKSGPSNNVNQIDLNSPITLDRFLQLRFNGLNIAVKLELYQESFKLVEDIHTLMGLSKRQPKPSMLLNYYENLAKIFNVSVNTLYRSISWLKFFNLYSQSQNATLENLKNYASIIVLSTLSITEQAAGAEDEGAKFTKLASLLHLPTPPSRDSVISSIDNPNFMRFVDEDIVKLFVYLEHDDFNPLDIETELISTLSRIHATANYRAFFNDLLNTVIVKIFKQIAKHYSVIRYDSLLELVSFKGTDYEKSPATIENLLIISGRENRIPSFTIDHDSNIVNFDIKPFSDSGDAVKNQLSSLAGALMKSLYNTDDSLIEKQEAERAQAIEVASEEIAREIKELQERKEMLEKRRLEEAAEEERRLEEAKRLKEEKIAAEKRAEKERQEQEAERRLKEQEEKEREAIIFTEKKKVATEINKKGIIHVSDKDLKESSVEDLKNLQIKKLAEDQKEIQARMKAIFKRNDHMERAMRLAELKLLETDRETQKKKDLEAYEATKIKLIEKANAEHAESIKLRDRLQKIVPAYKTYRSKIDSTNAAHLKKLREEAEKKLKAAKQERIKLVKEKKLADLIARQKAEEEERERAEAEAKAKAEAEIAKQKKVEEMAKFKAEMLKQREKDEKLLELQLAREAEAEARLNQHKSGPYRPPRSSGINDGHRTVSYAAPRSNPFGNAKPVQRSVSTSTPTPAPAPGSSGKPLSYAEKLKLKRQQQQQQQQQK